MIFKFYFETILTAILETILKLDKKSLFPNKRIQNKEYIIEIKMKLRKGYEFILI